MGLNSASLNGNRVLDARLAIPAWGASFHDVTIDGEVTITGPGQALTISDLTVKCAVLSGGPAHGRSFYRLVAGAGGWGTVIPSRSYANDAGVKLSQVLNDAAAACGETLDPTTIDPAARLGLSWTRPNDIAGRVLELVAPGAWYVGEDGVTRLGKRAPSTLSGTATATTQVDLARATVTLASDSIAGILPGLVVNGLTAVDVEHEISAKGGLRSKVWGQVGAGGSRRLTAWRAIFNQLDPNRAFRAMYEYRVVTQTGNRLNLQPVRVSTGMPTLMRVKVRPGVPGVKATHTLGSRVIVAFLNADPGSPVVVGFEDADGAGFLPTALNLANGSAGVARVGDTVQITAAEILAAGLVAGMTPVTLGNPSVPLQCQITSGSAIVTSG